MKTHHLTSLEVSPFQSLSLLPRVLTHHADAHFLKRNVENQSNALVIGYIITYWFNISRRLVFIARFERFSIQLTYQKRPIQDRLIQTINLPFELDLLKETTTTRSRSHG